MLKQVKLYGELADKYGKDWALAVNSPSEAVRALCANNPGFRGFLASSQDRGVGYKVMVGKTYIEKEEELYNPSGRHEIKIIPVVLGAKSGLGKILMGIALIWSGGWLAQQAMGLAASGALGTAAAGGGATGLTAMSSGLTGLNAASAIGSMVQGVAMKYGAAMIIGGIGQLLAGTPEEEPESFTFSGPVNTVRQGLSVPLCYGQLIVGGAVISSGIISEDNSA